MKTATIIIVSLMIGFGAAYLVLDQAKSTSTVNEASEQQLYTCGMHPEIVSNEPGYCPICGMKLTLKKDGSTEGSIVIDPTTVQNMGLKTTEVTRRPISRSILAFGKIQYSEPSIHTVNIKVPGWVEKLHVDYEGVRVESGQPLLELYSPELVAAQREYLVAFKNKQKMSSYGENALLASAELLNASLMRLLNWDISSDQIENLSKTGKLTKSMIIRSPVDGIVISKKVSAGDHLKAGAEVYRIADISKVWAVAYVYEQDVPFISLGQKARVELPYLPGEGYDAEISYISPFLEKNHQVEIRLNLQNPEFKLKPEMYAEVTIESEIAGDRLVIPMSTVINSGTKEIVYISTGNGSFEPRLIQTGIIGKDDFIEVKAGLSEHEKVVTSGQFLLDSESRLNESLHFAHSHAGLSVARQDVHSVSGDQDKHEHSRENKENTHDHEDVGLSEYSGIFTCPMPEHFHILQYGSGKCAECGMNLVPVEETDNRNVYYCLMTECQVVSNEPGSCPKCGMNLIKLE